MSYGSHWPEPDARIKPYIEHMKREGENPYVSTSWHSLADCYKQHGEAVVQELLDAYWAQLRAQDSQT